MGAVSGFVGEESGVLEQEGAEAVDGSTAARAGLNGVGGSVVLECAVAERCSPIAGDRAAPGVGDSVEEGEIPGGESRVDGDAQVAGVASRIEVDVAGEEGGVEMHCGEIGNGDFTVGERDGGVWSGEDSRVEGDDVVRGGRVGGIGDGFAEGEGGGVGVVLVGEGIDELALMLDRTEVGEGADGTGEAALIGGEGGACAGVDDGGVCLRQEGLGGAAVVGGGTEEGVGGEDGEAAGVGADSGGGADEAVAGDGVVVLKIVGQTSGGVAVEDRVGEDQAVAGEARAGGEGPIDAGVSGDGGVIQGEGATGRIVMDACRDHGEKTVRNRCDSVLVECDGGVGDGGVLSEWRVVILGEYSTSRARTSVGTGKIP